MGEEGEEVVGVEVVEEEGVQKQGRRGVRRR